MPFPPPPRVPRFVAFRIAPNGDVIALDDRGDLWLATRDVHYFTSWRPLPIHPDRTIPDA